jgi:hypothetical protein
VRNPVKSMAKGVGKLMGKQPKGRPDPSNSLYAELYNVWPDGTAASFDLHRADTATKDNLARGAMLDSWAYEEFKDACDRAGYELNPGHFGTYPPPIPAGWSPSETALKGLFAKNRWNNDFMHFMVARLKHLGRLRP